MKEEAYYDLLIGLHRYFYMLTTKRSPPHRSPPFSDLIPTDALVPVIKHLKISSKSVGSRSQFYCLFFCSPLCEDELPAICQKCIDSTSAHVDKNYVIFFILR